MKKNLPAVVVIVQQTKRKLVQESVDMEWNAEGKTANSIIHRMLKVKFKIKQKNIGNC